MIKKIQRQFVLLSMSSLLVVLAIIVGVINIVNYHDVVREADRLVMVLSENGGRFPPEMMGDKHKLPPPWMSPETPYKSRYFYVLLGEDKETVIMVDTGRIASVDSSEAVDYARKVVGKSGGTGFVDYFRYRLDAEENVVRVTFLDCRGELDAFHSFLWISMGISLAGFFVVFLLISFFSGRIIRPIAESYEKQKQFITDAGHELKTPLTIIHADADVLEMELGENEWIEDIQKQTKRLTDLTNELVSLARMEEQGDIRKIEFPVSDVVSETAASFQVLAQMQKKEFTLAVEPMLSMTGDEKAISQLVSILLDNALKYSPEGGHVCVILEKPAKQIKLEVGNTLVTPLSRDDLNRMFERFYRADASRNSQTGGHGIGLSKAKAIVEVHGGKISATIKDGDSLQITVTLPV